MKAVWLGMFACALLVFSTPAAQGDPAGVASPIDSRRIEGTGSFMIDWVGFCSEAQVRKSLVQGQEDPADPFVGGAEIRRAQLGVKGTISTNLALKLVYDFSSGEARPKDVYLELCGLPARGRVRVGHQYEPLNRLSGSSKFFLFLEKPLPNAFSSGRNTGIRVLSEGLEQRLTFSFGAFRDADGLAAGPDDQGYNLTARLTGLPVYRAGGRRMVHLGAFYSRRNPERSAVRIRQRPETHLGPYLADTGKLSASKTDVLGFEAAGILGSASLQAEYIQAAVDLSDSDALFSGYYVTATFLLTGESRAYSRKNGSFSRLTPGRAFDLANGGAGAWMLLLRRSHLDLNDGCVQGGQLDDLSFGLNWYLQPNVRMTWNYILADSKEHGDFKITQVRIQVET